MNNEWVLQKEDITLPEWLTSKLPATCGCGGDMENFYNNAGRITARRCSNPQCPYMMAEKIVGMCDILQVKGVGSKVAYKLIKDNNLQSHFEALPYIFTEGKPEVSLYDFLRMCFIQGIDTSWSAVSNKYSDILEVYENYDGEYRNVLEANKDMILQGAEFVSFKTGWKPKYDAVVEGIVMISGNLKGFDNRNSFIYAINKASNGLIRIAVSESKRKTGVMALIQEATTPNRGKAECALQNNIPIMTPSEFVSYTSRLLNERLKQKKECSE